MTLVLGSALVRSGVIAVLGSCLLGHAAAAAVSPNGTQFQVNTYTTNLQEFPSVAMDASGNFVVVWASEVNAGGDTSPWSVQGQRYDASGAAIGGEFQINTYTASSQIDAAVASDPAGNFVVVWQSFGSAGSDTDGSSVQGQRFDSSGSPVGGEFQVNTYTTGDQRNPAVARSSSGSFVVVWESAGSAGSDSSGWSVQGQPYDASGNPIGGELQVNTATLGHQDDPAVANDSSGNFIVVWDSVISAGSDNSNASVQGQRYDASGDPIGGEFQVNTYTTNSQIEPSVASDSAGNVVVVWESNGSVDSSNLSVQGQRYDASGSPIGTQFGISTDPMAHQGAPSVASDSSGNFVVSWHSFTSPGFTTAEVWSRAYEASGSAIDTPFHVNTYTTSAQDSPSVACSSQGDVVVAWQSWGSVGNDDSWYSIQGQRYLPEPSFVPGLGAMLALVIALARRRNPICGARRHRRAHSR